MPAESVKEALTQIDVERKHSEFVERYGLELANELIEHYKTFAEKYGKELADHLFQDKVEMEKVAKYYGSKLKKHYFFPMLENSLINRLRFARDIDTEGSICICHRKPEGKRGYYYLRPKIEYTNTSKGLAERMASWMKMKLPKPTLNSKYARSPVYQLARDCIPAIDLTCLSRPFLIKEKNAEKADKIIEMFKERASTHCDENRNPIPRPEPKYMSAYRLHQEGKAPEEIAQILGCSLEAAHLLVSYAKNPELHRKRSRDYYKQRMNKRPANADYPACS